MAVDQVLVCITFDHMGRPANPDKSHAVGSGDLELGLRVGYPRILELLEKHGVTSTFFLEGWNGENNTARVQEVVEQGHEVSLHGWVHEDWASLTAIEAAELIDRGLRALRSAGAQPVGFRAPGGERGPYTARLLAEAGLLYDASVGEDRAIKQLVEGVVHVPYRWSEVDGYQYFDRADPRTPEELTTIWQSTLDEAASEADPLTFVFHPHVTGVDKRQFATLEAVVERVAGDPRLRAATVREVAKPVTG
jgi:peptidoglycan/xylan/chitin deacetylase (PgdA/CDA1 family)